MRYFLVLLSLFSLSFAQKIQDFIKIYDKNKDGKVTLKEYNGDRNTFYKYDRDRNGIITEKEISKEGQGNEDLIKTFDKNANGFIEANEFPGTPEDFKRYDKNKDKRISPQEAKKGVAGGKSNRAQETAFDKMDKNKDGYLTKKETKLTKKAFQKFDKDKDNKVSRKEYLTLTAAINKKKKEIQEKNRGGKKRPQNANEFMARWDKDKDDVITPEELTKGPRYLFSQMDLNENKKITKKEATRYFRIQAAFTFMEKYDSNNDGVVTRAEFSGPEILFERCDFNQDGVITKKDRRQDKR